MGRPGELSRMGEDCFGGDYRRFVVEDGGRHVLGESVTNHRLDLMTQIIRILLVMIPNQRGESLREGEAVYGDFSASELAT